MAIVRHVSRRRSATDDGTILVGSTRYALDAEGAVEVTEEHAALMLQGSNWSLAGRPITQVAAPPSAPSAGPAESAPAADAAIATLETAETAADDAGADALTSLDTDALRELAASRGIHLKRPSRLALISELRKAER